MSSYKDLSVSDIKVTRLYGTKTVVYTFSSTPHKLAFQRESIGDNNLRASEEEGALPFNAKKCSQALNLHYKYGISPYDCAMLVDMETYRKIEKKGYYITIDGRCYNCQPVMMLKTKLEG